MKGRQVGVVKLFGRKMVGGACACTSLSDAESKAAANSKYRSVKYHHDKTNVICYLRGVAPGDAVSVSINNASDAAMENGLAHQPTVVTPSERHSLQPKKCVHAASCYRCPWQHLEEQFAVGHEKSTTLHQWLAQSLSPYIHEDFAPTATRRRDGGTVEQAEGEGAATANVKAAKQTAQNLMDETMLQMAVPRPPNIQYVREIHLVFGKTIKGEYALGVPIDVDPSLSLGIPRGKTAWGRKKKNEGEPDMGRAASSKRHFEWGSNANYLLGTAFSDPHQSSLPLVVPTPNCSIAAAPVKEVISRLTGWYSKRQNRSSSSLPSDASSLSSVTSLKSTQDPLWQMEFFGLSIVFTTNPEPTMHVAVFVREDLMGESNEDDADTTWQKPFIDAILGATTLTMKPERVLVEKRAFNYYQAARQREDINNRIGSTTTIYPATTTATATSRADGDLHEQVSVFGPFLAKSQRNSKNEKFSPVLSQVKVRIPLQPLLGYCGAMGRYQGGIPTVGSAILAMLQPSYHEDVAVFPASAGWLAICLAPFFRQTLATDMDARHKEATLAAKRANNDAILPQRSMYCSWNNSIVKKARKQTQDGGDMEITNPQVAVFWWNPEFMTSRRSASMFGKFFEENKLRRFVVLLDASTEPVAKKFDDTFGGMYELGYRITKVGQVDVDPMSHQFVALLLFERNKR